MKHLTVTATIPTRRSTHSSVSASTAARHLESVRALLVVNRLLAPLTSVPPVAVSI